MREIYNALHKNLSAARLTYLLALICVALFATLKYFMISPIISDELLTKFGAPTAIEIYNFQYWGIVSNSFVHYEIGHFILNLTGLILLGSYVERRIGFSKFFFLGLYASLVSSAFQLAFSDDAGIGLSGVNYALFGFIFYKSFYDLRFKMAIKNFALMGMLFFIPICEYMNLYSDWNVATIALISGFMVGAVFGMMDNSNSKIAKFSLIIGFIFSVVSLIYTPWSSQWNCAMGIRKHENGKIKEAKKYYEAAHVCNPQANCANDNLKIIKVDELSGLALMAHNRGQYIKAGKYYDQILQIDPSNLWAINNKKRLP